MDTTHLLLAIVLGMASLGTAEDFQVNVRTAGNQCNPAVATTDDGRFVAVWSSYYSSSGRSNEIMARLFDATNTVMTDEFQVNANRTGNQTEPAVAVGHDDSLFVVWQGPGADGEEDVFARRLTPNGSPLTNDLIVNTDVAGEQIYPRVATGAGGDFIVVWESQPPDSDAGPATIRGQRLDPNGLPVGAELKIDENGYNCRYPDVAMDDTGGFAVTWLQDRTNKTIRARLFHPDGLPRTDAFDVSTDEISSVTRPAIAMWATGAFVVVWDGDPDRAGRDDIHARCFDTEGVPQTDAFIVNAQRDGAQQWPRVTTRDADAFVVVWEHDHDDGDLATDIFGRCFERSGLPLGDQMLLNEIVTGKQRAPDAATTRDGSLLAIWESDDQDGSGYGLFASVSSVLPAADLNADAVVDFRDIGVLAQSWLAIDAAGWDDLTGDAWIDARDLKVLCHHWLE